MSFSSFSFINLNKYNVGSGSSSSATYTYTLFYDANTATDPNVESLAIDNLGNVYITSPNINQLIKVTPQLTTSTLSVPLPNNTRHRRIYIDSSNRLVVNDANNMYIVRNIISPTIATQLRASGNYSPVYIYPALDFMYYSSGAVYKATMNSTTYALGTASAFISGLSNANIIFQIAVQPSTLNVYVTDRGGNAIKRYLTASSTTETVAVTVATPVGLCFDNYGFLYVSEYTSGKIKRIDLTDNTTTVIATLTYPVQLVVNQQNILFITSALRYVYTLDLAQFDSSTVASGSILSSVTASGSRYLSTTSSKLTYGTSSFTYEFWFKPMDSGNVQGIFGHGPNATSAIRCFYSFPGYTNKLYVQANGQSLPSSSTFALNTWYHIAIVRNVNTFTLYVNGVEDAFISSISGFNNTNQSLVLFRNYTELNQEYFFGYLSNFRISKIARYTANFTPSTTTFKGDSDSLLILNVVSSNKFLYDSSPYSLAFTNNGGLTYSSGEYPTV